MKKLRIFAPSLIALCLGVMSSAQAIETITAEAGCGTNGSSTSCDGITDNYGFKLEISGPDGGTKTNSYSGKLTNTSSSSLADALIDAFAFNVNPDLVYDTDFKITNVRQTGPFLPQQVA